MEYKITTTKQQVVREITGLYGKTGHLTSGQLQEYFGWHRNTLARKLKLYGVEPIEDTKNKKRWAVGDIAAMKLKMKRRELAREEGRIVN